MDIANLVIRVTNDGLTAAQRELRHLRDEADDAKSSTSKLGENLKRLAKYGGAALAGFAVLTVKTAGNFEQAMNAVRSVSGATGKDFDDLRNKAKQLGADTEFSATQAANAMEELAKAGFNTAQNLATVPSVLSLASAGSIELANSAGILADIMGGMAIAAEDSSRVADVLAKTAASSATDVAGLGETFKYVGPVAETMGQSLETTAALIGALGDKAITGSQAGTVLRGLMLGFANDKGPAEAFKRFGISLYDSEGKTRDLIDVMRELGAATKDLGDADKISVLDDIGGKLGITGLAGILDAANSGALDALKEKLDAAAGSAKEMADIRIEGLNGQLKIMGSALEGLMLELADTGILKAATAGVVALSGGISQLTSLVPAVTEFFQSAEVATAFQMASEGLATAWGNLKSVIQATGEVIAPVIDFFREHDKLSEALAISIGLVAGAFLIYNAAVVIGTAVTGAFVGVLLLVTSPIFLIVAAMVALTAAGVYLYQNWDEIKAKGAAIWQSIKDTISNKMNEAKQALINTWNSAKTATVNKLNGIADSVVNTLKTVPAKVMQIGKDIIAGLIGGVTSKWNELKSTVSNIATSVVDVFRSKDKGFDTHSPSKKTHKIGEDVGQGLADGIKSKKKAVKSEAQKMAEQAVAAVKTGVENLKREIALFGNDSLVAALDYDIKIGKYRGANTSELRSLTQQKEQLELSKKITDANKAMQDSIDGLTKQLALFGNKSGLAEFDFDVSAGKHAGVNQSNIDKTRELLRALDMRNEEADVTKEMISLQRSIYDASVLHSTELGRMNYELDDVHGKYKNINEEIKDSLRNEAAKLDAVKLQATAVKSMLDIDRQMSLLGDSSLFSQLAYEMNEATGSLVDLDEGLKEAWLSKAALLDQARQELAINESIDKSLDSINKEIALMGDNSGVAELNYDLLNTDKYLHASQESVWKLREALTKLDNLKKGDALSAVMDEIAQESPMAKIEADYQRRLEIIDDYESQWTSLVGVHSAERDAIEQSYMDAKRDLLLTQGEALFSNLADSAKAFVGEQSATYKLLYGIQKGFAIASAGIALWQSVSEASKAPIPAKWGLMAAAAADGAKLVSTITSLTPKGFKAGGYTGNMGASQVAGVVHGQEYVFDAQATKRIGVDNLNAMRRGENPKGGGDVIINNYSSAKIEQRQDANGVTILDVRDEIKRSWGNTGNPNSFESKQLNRNIQAPRRR